MLKPSLSPGPFRRRLANSGTLLFGTVLSSLLSLAAIALAARFLGPAQFGILALVQSLAAVVDRVFNFQFWQPFIKYGSELLESERHDEFRGLVKVGTLLDISSAVLGFAAAVMFGLALQRWFGWDSSAAALVPLYSLVILANLSGTPTGVLRLFGCFREFAWQKTMATAIRLLGVVLMVRINAPLEWFVVVWVVSTIVGDLIVLSLSWLQLRARGFGEIWTASINDTISACAGFWSFVWRTNLHSSIRMGTKEIDVLLVGTLLGASSAGLYKVVKQASSAIAMVADPIYQVIYPDLAREWARRDHRSFVRTAVGSTLLTSCLAMAGIGAILLWGDQLLLATVGASYLQALPTLRWYVFCHGSRCERYSSCSRHAVHGTRRREPERSRLGYRCVLRRTRHSPTEHRHGGSRSRLRGILRDMDRFLSVCDQQKASSRADRSDGMRDRPMRQAVAIG
jgi:O-antigen/teichoic acid export membrane protein